ncbi:MAG: YfhO family protein [Lachnospiraceae bacterium]|nr:YfhO family protein [Lachnospiraceae bacterium]
MFFRKRKSLIQAFAFYTLIVLLANWSIIMGENLMKWDIWDAHYPFQIIVSDAIHSKSFPVWNPLYNFGTPYYAVIGSPVFYPFTLMFDIIGYHPNSPALEYSLHMIIAAMGMYLLAKGELKSEDDKRFFSSNNVVCLVAGIVYSFSGLFFSNAEHIMIIISAAWIPYVLYFARVYVKEREIIYACLSAICISMIVLGGYPEMLFDTIIVLILWIIINNESTSIFVMKIFDSLKVYVIIGVLSVFASAITLIPFINITDDITRGANQEFVSPSFISLLTIILPKTTEELVGGEISLQSFFVSTFCLIGVASMFTKKSGFIREKFFLLLSILFASLCFGKSSFVEMILYRFLPMYSTFRFSSLWRPFFTIFIILSCLKTWVMLLKDDDCKPLKRIIKRAIGITGILCLVTYLASTLVGESIISMVRMIGDSLLVFTIILFTYYIFLGFNQKDDYKKNILVALIVSAECLTISYMYLPFTVGLFQPTSFYIDSATSEMINNEYVECDTRNKNCDFANNNRSDSGPTSAKNIAMNKSFDSSGYMSIKLKSVEEYKKTFHYTLIKDNPEVYFTNSIYKVTNNNLVEWLNNPNLNAYDVAVANISKSLEPGKIINEKVDVSHFGFNSLSFEYNAKTEGIVTVLQANYPGWKLYIDGEKADITEVNGCFIGVWLDKGNHNVTLKFRPLDFMIGILMTISFYIYFFCVYIRKNKRLVLNTKSCYMGDEELLQKV